MKTLLSTLMIAGILGGSFAYAEESMSEKVAVEAKDAKRAVKKGAHRLSEKVCMKSDAKCLADKAKHRAMEAKDAVKDGASEVKNKVD